MKEFYNYKLLYGLAKKNFKYFFTERNKDNMNKKDFTKEDIKNGAVVELRNGERFLKLDNTLLELYNKNKLKENYVSYMLLDYYENNLTYKLDSDYDIMKILNPDNNLFIKNYNGASALLALNFINFSWTWERKEKRKTKLKDMTMEDYEKWQEKNCKDLNCRVCPFRLVRCSALEGWISNKELYSEKFLNQEIEMED